MERYLEYRDAKSQKFWHIRLDEAAHTVRYGRIGTEGQTQTKQFSSPAEARSSFDKLLNEKLKKGYQDREGATAEPPPAPPATEAASQKSKPAGWPACIQHLKPSDPPRGGWPRPLVEAFVEEGWSQIPVRLEAFLGSCATNEYPDCPNLPKHHKDNLKDDPDWLSGIGAYSWVDVELKDAAGTRFLVRIAFNLGDPDANDGPWGECWLRDSGEKIADIVATDDYLCRVKVQPGFKSAFRAFGKTVPGEFNVKGLAVPGAESKEQVARLLFIGVLLGFFHANGAQLEWTAELTPGPTKQLSPSEVGSLTGPFTNSAGSYKRKCSAVRKAVDAQPEVVHFRNAAGWTLLHSVIASSCTMREAPEKIKLVAFLLEKGADPNAINNSNWTPLHFLSHSPSPECLSMLLAAGADVNAVALTGFMKEEKTLLDLANMSRRTEFAALLLTHGARSASEIHKV